MGEETSVRKQWRIGVTFFFFFSSILKKKPQIFRLAHGTSPAADKEFRWDKRKN